MPDSMDILFFCTGNPSRPQIGKTDVIVTVGGHSWHESKA